MAIEAETVEAATFARLALEEGLRVVGPLDGFLWAAKPAPSGFVLYKSVFPNWAFGPHISTSSANPAAGANPVALTCGVGVRQRLVNVTFSLVTDANPANREVILVVRDGVRTKANYAILPVQTASLTCNHTFAPGVCGNATIKTYNMGTLPAEGVILEAGWSVQVQAINIQAGDDFSAVDYTYQEEVSL